MTMKAENIIRQYFASEEIERTGEKSFTTMRLIRGAFYLKTRNGPAEIIRPGSLVALCDSYFICELFFAGRGDPVEPGIPETGEYLVRRAFQTVIAGEYKQIPQGGILRLDRGEALDLMRRHLIKPLDEDVFYIP